MTQPSPTAYNRQDVETLFKQGARRDDHHRALADGPARQGGAEHQIQGRPDPQGHDGGDLERHRQRHPVRQFEEQGIGLEVHVTGHGDAASTLDLTLKEGFLPTTHSAADNPEVKAEFGAFTELLPVAKFAPQVPNWPQVVDITIAAIQRVYLGQEPAEAALGRAASQINDIIA